MPEEILSFLRSGLFYEDFYLLISEEDSDDESLSEELLLSLSESMKLFNSWAYFRSSAYFYSNKSFGAFSKNSLSPSVIGPNPILVKKLTANLAFSILSVGNIFFKKGYIELSFFNLSTKFWVPKFSAISWNNIFIKILLLDVVSSSVSLTHVKQLQSRLSVYKRWANIFAAFLILLTSCLCIISNYWANTKLNCN